MPDETFSKQEILEFLDRLVTSARHIDDDDAFRYVQELFVSGDWKTKPERKAS